MQETISTWIWSADMLFGICSSQVTAADTQDHPKQTLAGLPLCVFIERHGGCWHPQQTRLET